MLSSQNQIDFYVSFMLATQIIVTNSFRKKQPKLPQTEKDRAERNKKDYQLRVKKGEYYAQG